MKEKKSMVFIKNGYCCGHGQIVQKLENYLIRKGIPYKIVPVKEASTALYEDRIVGLRPTMTLQAVLIDLGLQSKIESQEQTKQS